ncbi:uncharacterized protein SAPINGB_P005266 [Magnusiomyces paraingens]|uniref:Very long-chain fatty acid transport protein n=1 Tax=Magnusiomyces paraingens TaxID=2606893 RepID=A0A5E8BYS1_9ASCO|nr:uncharacterized protein SAPINGB_P005266 [Saprochaete ingens]VVT56779.1 unnamed protein product [Saprochaete ingens]
MPPYKLQTLAIAALAATYLEARTLFLEDLDTAARVLSGAVSLLVDRFRGRINFFYVIERLAQSAPTRRALVFPRQVKPVPAGATAAELEAAFEIETFTFQQLYTRVLKYARVLANNGVNSSHTVALDCMNCPEFMFVWFAVWSLGATPAFINYNLTGNGLVHCIKTASPKLVLVDPAVSDKVDPVRKDLEALAPVVYMDNDFKTQVAQAEPLRAPDEARHPEHKPWDTACYIYTSGTTGLPKAAIMSWRKAKDGSAVFATATGVTSADTVYTAMPLYHSTASVLGVLAAYNKGAAVALGHKFSTTTFWTQVKITDATYIQYVGETGRYLLNGPVSPHERSHKVRVASGNGMRPDVWERFKERFGIPVVAEFFASTEGPLATTNYQRGAFGVGAVGRYGALVSWLMLEYTHALAKVDGENELWRDPMTGLCRSPSTGEAGELLCRIKNPKKAHETFQGYHGDKAATENKILRDVFRKGDAWVRSGDLLRKDSHGLLYFVDRLGDTFRWKSENVATGEVEAVVCAYEGISQAIVVGVRVPQHEGRAGFAVIEGESVADLGKFAQFLLARLPRYAVPVFIQFVPAIARTGNNKVQKGKYREQKFPGTDIYWLDGDTYVKLDDAKWEAISSGKVKL